MKTIAKKGALKPVTQELTTPGSGGRRGFVARLTKETRIAAAINLDGTGQYDIKTGIGYSRHTPFEHIYRHHRRYRITEGSEEIQIRRVAGALFGFWGAQKASTAPKG